MDGHIFEFVLQNAPVHAVFPFRFAALIVNIRQVGQRVFVNIADESPLLDRNVLRKIDSLQGCAAIEALIADAR